MNEAADPAVFTDAASLLTAVNAYATSGKTPSEQEYGDITYWDVSKVDNMDGLFGETGSGGCGSEESSRTELNLRIQLWDTSRVTSMSSMFKCNDQFNMAG